MYYRCNTTGHVLSHRNQLTLCRCFGSTQNILLVHKLKHKLKNKTFLAQETPKYSLFSDQHLQPTILTGFADIMFKLTCLRSYPKLSTFSSMTNRNIICWEGVMHKLLFLDISFCFKNSSDCTHGV